MEYPSLVQWDGDEPYLPVTPELRLTPFRSGDTQEWCDLQNTDQATANNWYSPIPYPIELAQKNVENGMTAQKPLVDALRKDHDLVIEGCPFEVLREAATGRVVGFCRLSKITDNYVVPPKPETALRLPYTPSPSPLDGPATPADQSPEWADENWNIGYVIHPDWGGKGITQKMVKVMIEGWVIPHMRLNHLQAGSASYNNTSHHILRKSGFHLVYGYWRTQYNGTEFDAVKFERKL